MIHHKQMIVKNVQLFEDIYYIYKNKSSLIQMRTHHLMLYKLFKNDITPILCCLQDVCFW